MNILKKILFPTDFGPFAMQNLENVMQIANKFNSEVILLHVLPDYRYWDPFILKIRKKIDEKLEEMTNFLNDKSNIKYRTIVEFGDYAQKIDEVARKENVNIILLGEGHRNDKDFRLGSNSDKIIRGSSIPVWVLEKDWPFSVQTILCPVDFSESSRMALDNAIHLARRFDSKLIVLHVTQEISEEYDSLDVDLELEKANYEKQDATEFDTFLKQFDFSELDWQKNLIKGTPHVIIKETITSDVVDLLIMGTHGREGIQRFFMGSVTEKVIKDVPCSFITVKSQEFIHLEIEDKIEDIETAYNEAVQLANDGFYDEAINRLNLCLEMNEYYLKAWRGKAEIYDRIGQKGKADACREMADKVQKSIWDKQVEADLMGRHSLFK